MEDNNNVNMNKENSMNNQPKKDFNIKNFGLGIAVGAGFVLIGRAITDWRSGRKARKAKQQEETPAKPTKPTEESSK